LISARLIDSEDVDRFRPILNLTERGWSVVRSQSAEPIELSLPEPLATKVRLGGLQRLPSSPAGAAPHQENEGPSATAQEDEHASEPNPLRDHLRALRNQWAREANLPAYCVFNNETIEGLVLTRPQTPAELARIKGLGPSKLEKYGELLLQAILSVGEDTPSLPQKREGEAHTETRGLDIPARREPRPPEEKPASSLLEEGGSDLDGSSSERPSASKAAGSNGTIRHEPGAGNSVAEAISPGAQAEPYVSTEEWTYRLFDRGFRLSEIVAIRGLERSAVIRHATWMARKGLVISPGLFLDAECLGRWESWFRERGEVPPAVSSDEDRGLWGLFLLCREAAPRNSP
jgi:ATP-dependent DNA helicase RecQ